MQSVPITTDVLSSNIDQGEVYNIMRQISGLLRVLRFPPLNKTDRNDISEILLKVALKQTNKQSCNTSDETIFERVISLFNLEYIIEMFVYTTDSYILKRNFSKPGMLSFFPYGYLHILLVF
jgi:predicted ATP-dependent Lon-type protease